LYLDACLEALQVPDRPFRPGARRPAVSTAQHSRHLAQHRPL